MWLGKCFWSFSMFLLLPLFCGMTSQVWLRCVKVKAMVLESGVWSYITKCYYRREKETYSEFVPWARIRICFWPASSKTPENYSATVGLLPLFWGQAWTSNRSNPVSSPTHAKEQRWWSWFFGRISRVREKTICYCIYNCPNTKYHYSAMLEIIDATW